MKNKKTFYFLFILLVLPIAHSITLDELLASYDYSYSSSEISVANIANRGGNDTDSNSLYDYLIIDVTTNSNAGSYHLIGDLYKDDKFIATYTYKGDLNSGQNTIPLYYPAKLLQSGVYDFTLTIQQDYLTLFREENTYQLTYNDAQFEKPEISLEILSQQLINQDADSKYETLRVNARVTSDIAETVEINTLMGNEQSINSKNNYPLNVGTNDIEIDFDASKIRKKRIVDAKLYEISIKDSVNYKFSFDYALNYNLNDLDSETSILTDSYSDSGSDTNSNSIYEYLIINIGLDIKESGTYFIELELQDQYNNYVKKLKNVYTLSTGERNIDFTIEGKGIYSTKINGPYIIESINLLKDNEIIDSASKTYTTSEYNSDDFEKPPLPDLEITDVEIQDNLVTVEIENTGSSYAFSFIVELFDEDFNSVGKKIVSYLAPSSSETLTYEIDTSSISILTAIIDYLNTIEESNEANNILVKSTEPPYQLNLQQGWNLISLPVKPLNNLISSIFSNDLLPLFSYDNLNSKWITYQSESSNNFDQVSEQSGIWVKSATTQSIEIDATDLTYPIEFSLKQGWNLVSYPAENTVSADTALNNVKSTISSVLTYKDGNWISYSPSKPSSLNTLPNLEPGRAYWIYIHQGATWTFDGSSYT